MDWSEFFDQDAVKSVLLPALVSVVTTLLTYWVTSKHARKEQRRDEERAQIVARLDVERNVVRQHTVQNTEIGPRESRRWCVNPFYITYLDGVPKLNGWGDHALEETRYGNADFAGGRRTWLGPLSEGVVQSARNRKDWIVFYEDAIKPVLTFWMLEPCDADDAFLFQPMPEPKRGLIDRIVDFVRRRRKARPEHNS